MLQFFKNLSRASAVSALATSSSYLLTIFLARNGGPVKYGEYALCMAWAAIIITVINFASDSAFAHLVANRNGDVQGAFNTIITVRILIVIVVLICFMVLKSIALISMPWMALLLVVPAFNLGFIYEYYQNNLLFVFNIFAEKTALLILSVILLKIYEFQNVVYVLYFVVSIIFLIFQIFTYKLIVKKMHFVAVSDAISYFISYWPVLFIGLSQLGYGYYSRLVVENKLGVEVFSNVSLAFQVIALSSVYQGQVDRVFRRQFIDAGLNNNHSLYKDLFKKYIIFATLPLFIGSIVLYVISPKLILLIFGVEYKYAGEILRVISPLLVSANLMRLIDVVMLSRGLVKYNLSINISIMIIMLIVMIMVPFSASISAIMSVVVISQYIQIIVSYMLLSYMEQHRCLNVENCNSCKRSIRNDSVI
jgi:O-antigen/teichoic acid export membrane protein